MMQLVREDPVEGMSPDEAAAHWRIRKDRGDLATHERAALERWLASSPANAAALAKADRLWALFDDGVDQHLDAMRGAALAVQARSRPTAWTKVAAALAVVGVPALALLAMGERADAPPPRVTARTTAPGAPTVAHQGTRFETRRGERLGVTLPDGTAVTLNTDTAIEIAFTAARRSVRLMRGQALFDVAKDARRPFVVRAAGREVTALGTVFDVRLDAARVKVLLVEGRVAVTKVDGARPGGDATVVLRAGQGFTAGSSGAGRVASVDTQAALLWREGLVELNDVTLADAAAELNRYSPRRIAVRDPRIASLRVSGVFRTGAPERFVQTVGEVLPIAARPAGDAIEIVMRYDAAASPAPQTAPQK